MAGPVWNTLIRFGKETSIAGLNNAAKESAAKNLCQL